ncbi:Gfo/Idh/MocA family oxidoreductase [Kribbella sp. NPDC051770]|uniref:Gfo/Idh/MocA family protein n=1 Tax=Kribbella sp. NPDC051770 TaxID=3155413 RepID=UPI00342A1C69
MPLELGLIGATGIAARTMIGKESVDVRAVAASDPVRAKEFAGRYDIPLVYESYSALLADPAIDAVYISLHNSAHHRWAVRAAVAGKDVIVEKPLCLTAAEAEELCFAAADTRVFEAVATAGHPWQATVRGFVEGSVHGELRSVESRMTFAVPAPGGYRDRPDLGGGIFYDCASYWLQALQATTGLDVTAYEGRSAFDGPNGVDRDFTASLRWASGAEARLTCAVGADHVAEHLFTFEHATVKLRNFLRPVLGAVPLNLIVTPADGDREVIGFPPTAYYEQQLARILAEDGDDLEAALPRIQLMEAIYSDALSRRENR